ncbi:MAG: hypothetical protein AAFU51_18770 [Bacteroidota bacterium]
MTEVYDDVVEMVSAMLAGAICEREASIDATGADADVRGLLRAIGLRTTQVLLEAETTRVLQNAAARGYTVNQASEISVGCLYGELRVSSPHLRRAVGDTARPVRDELGLTHRSKTPALERALTDFGIEDSFGVASERFEEHYGWTIHRTSLLRVVHNTAKDALTFVEEKLAKEPDAVEPAACLLVEMDGCELRTGTMGSPDPVQRTPVRGLPRRKRPLEYRDVRLAFCRALHEDDKSFVGGMSPFAEVVDQLHAAARHRGLTERTVVATVVDGGNGLREAIEARFGECIVVLDRPHVSQHLHDVAKQMKLDDKARFAWVSRVLEDFYEGRVAKVYAELHAYRGPGEERVERFLKHLWRFQDAVDYGTAHAWGIPQGSGEIESAHRYIPQKRLKIPGACWHPDSMNRLLALRIVRANGWWDEFWSQRLRPAQAAA